jgi:hypothetical protein
VQGKRVENAGEFRDTIAQADLKQGVRLIVRSGEAQRFVFLRAGDR